MQIQKTEPAESANQVHEIVPPTKVDYATDLFNILSMDDSGETATGASGDDNNWAGFQCMCKFSFVASMWSSLSFYFLFS